MIKSPAGNKGLGQWRVAWLIEHSTSHQLLWYVDTAGLEKRLKSKRSEEIVDNKKAIIVKPKKTGIGIRVYILTAFGQQDLVLTNFS